MYLTSPTSEPAKGQAESGKPEDEARLDAVAGPRSASPWSARTRWLAGWVAAAFARPRVRLFVAGVILLLGGLVLTSSVWTLPLLIAGAVMLVIGWIGSRLDGRFAVQWGESGTQLEFRAQIKAAPAPAPAPAPVPVQPAAPSPGLQTGTTPAPGARPEAMGARPEAMGAELEDAEIVDGEAHTVEIALAELTALIAAPEAEEITVARNRDGSGRPAA